MDSSSLSHSSVVKVLDRLRSFAEPAAPPPSPAFAASPHEGHGDSSVGGVNAIVSRNGLERKPARRSGPRVEDTGAVFDWSPWPARLPTSSPRAAAMDRYAFRRRPPYERNDTAAGGPPAA